AIQSVDAGGEQIEVRKAGQVHVDVPSEPPHEIREDEEAESAQKDRDNEGDGWKSARAGANETHVSLILDCCQDERVRPDDHEEERHANDVGVTSEQMYLG